MVPGLLDGSTEGVEIDGKVIAGFAQSLRSQGWYMVDFHFYWRYFPANYLLKSVPADPETCVCGLCGQDSSDDTPGCTAANKSNNGITTRYGFTTC